MLRMKSADSYGRSKKKNPERKPTGSRLAFLNGALAKQVKTDPSSDDIIIAVMGPTGSGKSSFINIITGFDTNVGHNLESCTSKVSAVRLPIPEMAFGDLVFIDTPGFDDTHKSEVDILKMVADWLRSTYEKDTLLSGLLYFHRICDNRMAGTPLKSLRMFEELCGKNAFHNVILTTTMWDEVDEETGDARETELKSKYWKFMLDHNSASGRFMRTRESAFFIIDPLIDAANKRSLLLLQNELSDMQRKLPSVSAGQELFSKMGVLVRQREDLLRQIRNEMQRADNDRMTLKPLQQEHQRLRIDLEAIVNEIQRLKLPLGNRSLNMTNKSFSSMDSNTASTIYSYVSSSKSTESESENLRPVDHESNSIFANLARQLPTADSTLSNDSIAFPVDVQGPKLSGSEPQPADSTLHTTEEHGQDKAVAFFPKEMVNEPIPVVGLPAAQKPETESFHSTMLPNFRVSVYDALTTFETRISPWMHPSEWLDANTRHICSIFDGIVNLTANVAITFPATKIFQRLIAYMSAYNMLCSSDEIFSGELNETLKKYQDWDILNQMRSQGNIKNQLLLLFRNASPEHREKKFEGLLQKLLVLDSIALSANVEALITDEETYEELVGTTGAGAQSLVNLLHARLDFPMDSKHKRLLVRALTRLSERSGLYPESLTLNNVTPEHGRRATGGSANVYKGKCFGEEIALKVFTLPSNNLFREFITWRQLSHPNVLPFYGVHFLDDPLETRFCLVSPWMENGNVVEFLARRNRMDPYNDATDCVSLALDIAYGVKYLHGEKVVHRDLKGYNILISPSLRAYIADFGLATLTDSGSATTLPGNAIMGTPKWLAPELIPHEEVKRKHTYASDIYAFALVCYELFSGKVPFEDVQLYGLQFLLERGERPSLPTDDLSQRRGLNPEMQNVIQDCWAQDPMKRPSADKVVQRLQRLRSVDQRPPNEVGTSFFTQLMRNQVDNPFAILYGEQHGFGLRA